MQGRKKRLDKLIQHREREVEARLGHLAQSRNQEAAARTHLAGEEECLRAAEERRMEVISRPLDAKSLALANDWMVACSKRRDLAGQALLKAEHGVNEARGLVVTAKNELRKIELISEQWKTEERVRGERVEQRMSDEFAALRFSEANRRRGEP